MPGERLEFALQRAFAHGTRGVNGDQDDNSELKAGAAYVFVRDGTQWSQQAYLKASNTGVTFRAGFGNDVAISGETIAVSSGADSSDARGIDGDQDNSQAPDSGAVYVFTRSDETWSQQAYVKASNTEAGDAFGVALDLSGDTLAVGAFFEDSSATGIGGNQDDNSAELAGAVYVFHRDGTRWSQQAYLKASNTEADDNFGGAVAIDGNLLVVGAHDEASSARGVDGNQNDNSATSSGAAYVFARDGGQWSQRAYLKASNAEAGDILTGAAAVSGGTIVLGAYREDSDADGVNGDQDDNSADNAGAAYVFSAFSINPGLNDAWFNPATAGQGVFVTVYPMLGKIFIAMFTYDTGRPPVDVVAIFGEPGHRWFTALGDYADNVAVLEAVLTSGGIFDSGDPPPTNMPQYGTITLTFIDCNTLLLTYDFPGLGLMGEIPLTRVATDNVALCRALSQP